jgi:hypothetical protein
MRGICGDRKCAGFFLELLAERHAGEVISTGLLDTIARHRERIELPEFPMSIFDSIIGQELAHIRLLERAMRILGGSPSAPSARARQLECNSEHLRRIVREERGGFVGSLEALLFAELRDEVGWETLLPFAGTCLGSLAWEFRGALLEKKEHARILRDWIARAHSSAYPSRRPA